MLHKTIAWIFCCSVLMSLLLIAILLAETVPDTANIPHPEHPGMQIGGDGALRLQNIAVYGYLFQALFYFLVVSLCVLGIPQRHRDAKFYFYMSLSLLAMWLVWWRMSVEHQSFLETGETGYFMGFPYATAWLVYGHWLSALPLILVYTFGFRRYVYTAQDEARFNRLLQETRADSTQTDTSP